MSIRPLGWARSESYFSSGSGKAITDAFQRLRTALNTPEWNDRLAEFLRDFDAWKPAGAEIDVFHQRMTVLHGLYQVIPPGRGSRPVGGARD